MANLNQYVNMAELPEAEERDFELIPDCKLKMHIVKEEVTQNDNGVVQWKTEMEVIEEGKYKSRKIWNNITLTNSDGGDNTIGRSLLRSIWEAVGLPLTEVESSKACFKPFIGTVRTEKSKEAKYKDKNKVTYAAPLDAAPKAAYVKTDPPFGASEEAATAAKQQPWKKKA